MSNATSFCGPDGVLSRASGDDALLAYGADVPEGSSEGYATGCLFLKTDGGFGTAIYVNEGTSDQANFKAFETNVGWYVDLPLTAWRKVNGSGVVPSATDNGGVLANDTLPAIAANANEALSIFWDLEEVSPIAIAIALPPDLDGTSDCFLDLHINAGTSHDPSFTVETSWDSGTNTDHAVGGSVITGFQTITATISPSVALPRTLTIGLTPGEHDGFVISLFGARLRYKRKSTM
jgi:hypothetical protein